MDEEEIEMIKESIDQLNQQLCINNAIIPKKNNN